VRDELDGHRHADDVEGVFAALAGCGDTTRLEQYPVLLGAVARAAGMSPTEAAHLAVHGVLLGVLTAAPKLFAIDYDRRDRDRRTTRVPG
jgi:urease accessory protein UreF